MEFQAYDIGLVPVIVALVGLVRMFGLAPRWLPFLSLAFGILAGFVYIAPDNPAEAVLTGIVMGLSAIGSWSGVKNTLNIGQK